MFMYWYLETGLIAQMSGCITCQRYQYICIFVDHHSDFTYIHLINTQSGYELFEAKEAFEAFTESHGVNIKNYHAEMEFSGVHN